MKPEFYKIQDGDQTVGIYDITKISMLVKIDNCRSQIIIDGQFFTFTYPDKATRDSAFDSLMKAITELHSKP